MVHTPPWYNGPKGIGLGLNKYKNYLIWSKCDSYDQNVNPCGQKFFLKKMVIGKILMPKHFQM